MAQVPKSGGSAADGGPVSAKDLRKHMAEVESRKASEALAKAKARTEEEEEFKKKFLKADVTENDRNRIRQRVLGAAERGDSEFMVIQFPAAFCTDGGRRINNDLSDWPDSLTGQARKLFEIWEANAKPLGYRLEARILNYPGGKIGDVGLYVKW